MSFLMLGVPLIVANLQRKPKLLQLYKASNLLLN
jgi:hypothetical protein